MTRIQDLIWGFFGRRNAKYHVLFLYRNCSSGESRQSSYGISRTTVLGGDFRIYMAFQTPSLLVISLPDYSTKPGFLWRGRFFPGRSIFWSPLELERYMSIFQRRVRTYRWLRVCEWPHTLFLHSSPLFRQCLSSIEGYSLEFDVSCTWNTCAGRVVYMRLRRSGVTYWCKGCVYFLTVLLLGALCCSKILEVSWSVELRKYRQYRELNQMLHKLLLATFFDGPYEWLSYTTQSVKECCPTVREIS